MINIGWWLRRTAAGVGLALAGVGGLSAAQMQAGAGQATVSADTEKAAANSFATIYGSQEKAALQSRDGADNIALAQTLHADAQKISDNPAMVRCMRDHAAILLFKSGDSAAYTLAVDLEKAALERDQATPLAATQQLAEMVAAGVKDVPAADRTPLYQQLVGLYQTLAGLQIQARDPEGAVKSLGLVANFAGPAGNRDAGKDANALALLLRPMIRNAQQLDKDLAALKATPDDVKLNTEVVQLLVRDWGTAGAAETYLAKADAAQVKGVAEMQKYETGGRKLDGMTADEIKTLAGHYEAWSKDGRDSKLAKAVLTRRAAELYQALAATLTGSEQLAATKTGDLLSDNATRYEKEAGQLMAAVEGGSLGSSLAGGSAAGGNKIPQKSLAEVNRIIDTEGATDPSWLAGVKMNYPNTLDLTWQKPPQGSPWNQSKWLGQFIWSTINENSGQWQNGVKVMYKVMDVNKADPDKLQQTYNAVARMYFNYFKDYARAAYWWKKAGNTDTVEMAHCFYHLGNADMAKKILTPYSDDTTRHADVARAWADFGDFDRALKMALRRTQTGTPDVGWLAAGDVARQAQKFDEALKHYDEVLKLKGKTVSRDYAHNETRARDGYDTIKYFNLFDLSKVPDGTFKGTATGYRGPVEAVVTVQNRKITDVKVNHKEDQYYSSITDVPAEIIAKQTVKGINATAGATMTANAIVMGAAKAVGNAMKP